MKSINLLYMALLGGQMLFCLVVIYLITGGHTAQEDLPMFQLLVPAAIIGTAVGAWWLNGKYKGQGKELPTPSSKLLHYRMRVIMRAAILEGANLLALVAAMVTSNMNYIFFFLVGLAAFIYFRPTQNEFEEEYQ